MSENRLDLTFFSAKIAELKKQIASVLVGQEQIVDLVLTAILGNGHVLIEGVPGVAKTLLARLISKLIDADFSQAMYWEPLYSICRQEVLIFIVDLRLPILCLLMKSIVLQPKRRLLYSR